MPLYGSQRKGKSAVTQILSSIKYLAESKYVDIFCWNEEYWER
jgi:hypothetical protein